MVNPFEHATAADFDRSSARDDRTNRSLPFDEWVEQYLEAARIAYEASEGNVDPWVVLVQPGQVGDQRRLFTPDSDETNAAFYARVRREAKTMSASQVFVATIARSAYGSDLPSATDVADQDLDETFQESIIWYAESPEATRYGMIPVQLGRAGEPVENESSEHDGASPLFVDILRWER